MMRRLLLASVACLALVSAGADARLTRLVVLSTQTVAAGRPGAPAYVILRGRYEGALAPSSSHNRIITDIALAPRLPDGRVGYSATFEIAMPSDPVRSSGFLVYDVPNRGNGTVTADGDGHVRVVSGWQGDIAPQTGVQTLTVPVAVWRNGRPLTAPVLQRFTDMPNGAASIPIVGGIGRLTPRPMPLSLDTRRAMLTVQASDASPAIAIAPDDWAFADCRTTRFPGSADPSRLCVRGGFDAAKAYTLTYEGKDPKVLGIGFAAVRDLTAFLRYGKADDVGTPNPLAARIRWSIITGTSQSGNFVRSMIDLGFNADEDGRRVFDGANPNIAARQVPLNVRFGVPGGAANPDEPGSEGTLWWGRYQDRVRGRGFSSLLDRCHATSTCPLIVETFGASEFWGLRMSPDLVGTDAASDIALPEGVRRYYFPGVTHGGSPVGGFPVTGEQSARDAPSCALAGNPNPSSDTRRAVLKMLFDWVSKGKAPLASRYPTLASGDLVLPTGSADGMAGDTDGALAGRQA